MVEELEKALAYPLQPTSPLWLQYGLSLIATGKHWRGLVALEEHLSEHKHDAVAHLFAAKVCINYLGTVDDGLRHALAAGTTTLELCHVVKLTRSCLLSSLGRTADGSRSRGGGHLLLAAGNTAYVPCGALSAASCSFLFVQLLLITACPFY